MVGMDTNSFPKYSFRGLIGINARTAAARR